MLSDYVENEKFLDIINAQVVAETNRWIPIIGIKELPGKLPKGFQPVEEE